MFDIGSVTSVRWILHEQEGVSMELADRLLVERFVPINSELRELVEAHHRYEKDIDTLKERPWLTPFDRQSLRVLKKRKLRGRDRIEEILRGYRLEVARG